jgi:acetyl-CoA carboxylase carboxyl transferase subunit beta
MVWPSKKSPKGEGKRTLGKGVFRKCDGCGETRPAAELTAKFEVCPSCGHHHRLGIDGWRKLILDGGLLDVQYDGLRSADPLEFSDGKAYKDRVASAMKATGATEAIEVGLGAIDGRRVAYASYNFAFMGGSLGSVVGEKLARLFERAVADELPVVLLQASGGARMQEGILSLMQMAKTVAALERLRAAHLPFISILRDPTTGGVAASLALLGDVNIAEPGALIGFAGPRVIEQTIRQKLPEGFQRAEFLLSHGMVDRIVSRLQMKVTVSTILGHLLQNRPRTPSGP